MDAIEHFIIGYLGFMNVHKNVFIICFHQGAEVIIEQSNVDFGLVRLGEASQTVITIQNTCRVPAKWSLREAETHADVSHKMFSFLEF